MTYLVLRISSIGNVAMTIPVLASVSARYPEDRFIIVSKKRLTPLFYGLPNVRFHEADFTQGGLKSIIRLFHELQHYDIDAVIDLQDVLRTQLLRVLFAWHHKKVYSIAYGRREKRALTLTGYRGANLITEFERYARTFRMAGLESGNEFEQIAVNKEAQQRVKDRYGIKVGQWIGIAPFAKHTSNRLSYRTMREVIAQVSEQPNTRVYLFGAGEVECEMLHQWAGLFPNVISVAGHLPLDEELELMRMLDIMLCMDSANQHLASLVHLRAVSVWCATHPAAGFYGWKQAEDDCIQTCLSCRPCTVHGTERCRFMNYKCKNIKTTTICQKLLH